MTSAFYRFGQTLTTDLLKLITLLVRQKVLSCFISEIYFLKDVRPFIIIADKRIKMTNHQVMG